MIEVKGISGVTATEGTFSDVVPAGYILGLMDVTVGVTGPKSKAPGTTQLTFHYDIVKGEHAGKFKAWSKKDGQVDEKGRVLETEAFGTTGKFSKYLKKYYQVTNLGTLKFALAHLATQSKEKQRAVVNQMLATEQIDEEMLPKLCLTTGALLEWDKKGWIEINKMLTIEEAEATGPTGTPRPAKKVSSGGGGAASDFAPQEFSGVEDSDPFGGGAATESAGTEEPFGF